MITKTRVVTPCGFINTIGGEAYFLISPEPIVRDSWQDAGTYRFVVVPTEPDFDVDRSGGVFSYARHIVTNCFSVEYRVNLPPITIVVLDEIDITEIYQRE